MMSWEIGVAIVACIGGFWLLNKAIKLVLLIVAATIVAYQLGLLSDIAGFLG